MTENNPLNLDATKNINPFYYLEKTKASTNEQNIKHKAEKSITSTDFNSDEVI